MISYSFMGQALEGKSNGSNSMVSVQKEIQANRIARKQSSTALEREVDMAMMS